MEPESVTVFLVEDDDVDARAVMRAFKKQNITNKVVRARDGVEALEMLNSKQITAPFLLLVDINMPRMNGIEFIQALRNDKCLSRSIVFVLTTSKMQEDINKAYNLNVAGYIPKDRVQLDFVQLISALQFYWHLVEFPKGCRLAS